MANDKVTWEDLSEPDPDDLAVIGISRETFETQYQAARGTYERDKDHEPQALRARYDKKTNRLLIELKNRVTVAIPVDLIQVLSQASPDDLSEIEIWGDGYMLDWPRIDVNVIVPDIMMGITGTKAWMRKQAQKGGASKSEKKATTSRENGKKGGRPRKAASA